MGNLKKNNKAIIVGGSLGGLFTGLHLIKNGWDVQIFERASEQLNGRGAGIVTHKELFESLRKVGIEPSGNIGVEVPGRVAFATDGHIIEKLDKPQILTSWGKLFELLISKFPANNYHRGEKFEFYEENERKVTVHFSSGRVEEADLLVAADGIRSAVRSQVEPNSQPVYTGYIAWRGLVSETSLSERARQEMAPYFSFSLPDGEQMLGYPVVGDNNSGSLSQRRYNFVWYRPADQKRNSLGCLRTSTAT